MLKYVSVFLVGITVGALSVYFYNHKNTTVLSDIYPIRSKSSNYTFINPLLAYNTPVSEVGRYHELEDKITGEISKMKSDGKVDDVSVYFRNLNTGQWVGINEDKEFNPASLYKLPIMVAYYKEAETNPGVLTLKVEYKPSDGVPQDATPVKYTFGNLYTVDELINDMIINSDNVAFNMLLRGVDRNGLKNVFDDLGISYPNDVAYISPKDYAMFFRVLYNSTYLNREMSERALKLLSQTSFKSGLASSLPDTVFISHKFGIRTLNEGKPGQFSELHDCGIVYKKDNHYLICIFTKGKPDVSPAFLAEAIEDISKIIYANQ
ncbi:MAG: Beta-lactamase [Parcubacteria bacterium C7867-006]|nr:MAG: Beta-lactamase [Parcubacteria bacterium C7867-006]